MLTVGFAMLTARSLKQRRADVPARSWGDPATVLGVSRRALYLNATASQGLLLLILVVLIGLTGIAFADLGLPGELSLPLSVAVGVGFGIVLAGLNHLMQWWLDAIGIDYDDALRALLTPSTMGDWLILLVIVLPVVAAFEELLFRGVLIGGLTVGFEVSPWLLAVVSSIIFAAGHGLQGRGGLIAAGILGLALAVGFVLTESLVVVIIAHYVVNTLEFVRHR